MRTRFLNIDYFSPIQALEPQTFLHLPVPHLPPPPLPPPSLSSFNDLFTSFASPLHVSSALHDLPLDSALSDFLSAVLPHRIDHADIEHSDAAAPTPCFRETRLSQVKTISLSLSSVDVFELFEDFSSCSGLVFVLKRKLDLTDAGFCVLSVFLNLVSSVLKFELKF